MKKDPIKLWLSTTAPTSKWHRGFLLIVLCRFWCRLKKLRRKSLFVKVQKINGNLKRLSRKILFSLAELPFILIYQTMSSIYVCSSKVNICFCLIYYFSVYFCTFFVIWLGLSLKILQKMIWLRFLFLRVSLAVPIVEEIVIFSRSYIVLWAGLALNSNLYFFCTFKYSVSEQPRKANATILLLI